MKRMFLVVVGMILAAGSAHAQYYPSNGRSSSYSYGTGSNSQSHSVQGYETNRGTYVQPYQATNPNNTQMDNYGSRGNLNPYTGQYGTRSPHY